MSKSRPEEIKLKSPHSVADEIGSMLEEHLHKRAKLKREDETDLVVFTFWPTKSEYFLVSMLVSALTIKKNKLKAEKAQ